MSSPVGSSYHRDCFERRFTCLKEGRPRARQNSRHNLTSCPVSKPFPAFGPYPGYFLHLVPVAFLTGCKPRTLTKIAIKVVKRHGWINVSNDNFQTLTGQPEKTTEAVCLHVTDVRLKRFFLPWHSILYHGLTVLHLINASLISIPESQFVSMLRSSPGLCILKLGLEIDDLYAGSDPVVPVSLANLEVLVVSSDREWILGVILRWIAPGMKPLSLSILNPFIGGQTFPPKRELSNFFARSNVIRIHAKLFGSYSQLVEVLSLAPSIRALAVDFLSRNGLDGDSLSYDTTIYALYIIRSPRYAAFD
ncbi:hypothetical protein B0J17DRAFT_772812 [Rhizoctonia solani]|nr:hypothetical protein B0J17DRAFT_772812 [Rhizoctonia solani]